jgi:chlorobactene glucosyltransferase
LTPELSYLFLSTFILVLGIIVTYWVHNQYYLSIVIPEASPPNSAHLPKISVIVPVRNEARNILRCLLALDSQTYANLEVIVVDDRSTDSTPKILADFAAGVQARTQGEESHTFRILQGSDLPTGWVGKPHALNQGYAVSKGEWLCFIDADTFASPDLITATFQAANTLQADMLSILTYQELNTFWEKVVLPIVFIALSVGFPAERVNDPQKPDAIANGQFILIPRSVYQAVGGHKAVRDEIAEDRALAALVKRSGYRLVIGDGRDFARTRMYTSLPEIWEGWTKNIFLGLRDRLWLLALGAVVGLIGALALPLWTILSFFLAFSSGSWIAYLGAVQSIILWGYLLYKRVQASHAMDISAWYALTLPLGALVFTLMMFTSGYRVLSGKGVVWRGRSYS